MMTINDPVFGHMDYDYEWEKREIVTLWGKEFDLLIIAQSASKDAPIEQVQHDAYLFYKKHFSELLPGALAVLIEYYHNCLDVPSVLGKDVLTYSTPTSIFFGLFGEWGILFDSEYDAENGIALKYSDGKWEAGPQDILI